MIKGKVHSIETLGTLDGPGIRFVIFMQGCILKCKFCHNRDTWDTNIGTEYSVDDLVEDIKKYKPYMESSGGGVTVTGGEPLLQADFLIELFTNLKKIGVHTCIDTSACLPVNDTIVNLLKLTDLVLLDIKHIDEQKCIELTGISNKYALNFARFLSDNNIPCWIRHVIIPTITDNEQDLKDLGKFVSTLTNVKKVNIIPYHSMGRYKWEKLGFKYPLDEIRDANSDDVLRAFNLSRIIYKLILCFFNKSHTSCIELIAI